MKVKVVRIVKMTISEDEASLIHDGLLAIAQREISGHPEADVQRARLLADTLKDGWKHL